MRRSTLPIRRECRRPETTPTHSNAVRIAPSALTLPAFAPAVPPTLRIWDKTAATASIAEALLDAQLLKWNGNLTADTFSSIDAWVQSQTTWMPEGMSNVGFSVTDEAEIFFETCDYNYSDEEKKLTGGAFALCIIDEPYLWEVGKAVQRLEKVHKGLGYTLAHILERSLDHIAGCTGPVKAQYIAQSEHWRGENNENELLQELKQEHTPEVPEGLSEPERKQFLADFYDRELTGEERADLCEEFNVFTYDEFHGEIPEEYYSKLLCNRTLKEIAKSHPKLCKAIELAVKLRPQTSRKPSLKNDCPYSWDKQDPFVLYWEPWGVVGKLYDDHGTRLSETGESHSICFMAAFDNNDPASIRKALIRMGKAFTVFHDAYTLLDLLAKPVTRQ